MTGKIKNVAMFGLNKELGEFKKQKTWKLVLGRGKKPVLKGLWRPVEMNLRLLLLVATEIWDMHCQRTI